MPLLRHFFVDINVEVSIPGCFDMGEVSNVDSATRSWHITQMFTKETTSPSFPVSPR
jgi:hypothetical protein